MRACVLSGAKRPLVVEEVELAEPGAGEVPVGVDAVGVSHTDLHAIKGDMSVPAPVVLGHEGAGVGRTFIVGGAELSLDAMSFLLDKSIQGVVGGKVGRQPGNHQLWFS